MSTVVVLTLRSALCFSFRNFGKPTTKFLERGLFLPSLHTRYSRATWCCSLASIVSQTRAEDIWLGSRSELVRLLGFRIAVDPSHADIALSRYMCQFSAGCNDVPESSNRHLPCRHHRFALVLGHVSCRSLELAILLCNADVHIPRTLNWLGNFQEPSVGRCYKVSSISRNIVLCPLDSKHHTYNIIWASYDLAGSESSFLL